MTLLETAAHLLRASIDSGKLPGGAVLLESALFQQLSISRTTVRRTLAMREDEGLLRRLSGRGYLVGL